MTASIAKLRLKAESIEQKKLAELKEVAAELGLSTAEVKAYGSLTLKATWLEAVNHKIAELFGGNEVVHSPEGLLEDSLTIILTEEFMIAPDSENFVEPPVPPSSLPVEFPEPEDEQNPENNGALNPIEALAAFMQKNFPELQPANCIDIFPKDFDKYPQSPGASDTIPFDGDDDWIDCSECDGFGFIGHNHDEICHHCYGEGLIPPDHTTNPLIIGKSSREIALEVQAAFDGIHTVGEPCETCNGTGLVPDFNGDGDEICPDCEGTGYATEIAIATSIDDSKTEVPTTLGTGEPLTNSLQVGSIDDLEASDFEKETIVEFFRSEGMPEQDIQELQSKPLSKLEASACLGFVECYKKSAEIAMRLYLVDWVNDLAGDAARCLNRADQMSILFTWKFISEVKVKLAHHFQLRPGEINCFLTPDGYRVSVPTWTKEQILTPQETEFITANDPVIEMFGNGYLHALEHFKEQVTLQQVEVS